MKQDRISGLALIVGSLGAIVTMVLHPIGGSLRTDAVRLADITTAARAVHILAIVSFCVQVFGFLGLCQALGMSRARVRAGLVAFALGWIAVIGAAIASGLLAPALIEQYQDIDATERAAMHIVYDYNAWINHTLAWIFVWSTSIGMLLWSLATLGYDRWWKATSVLGLIVGGTGLLMTFAGWIRLDVHGFGMVILGYSAWVVAVGILLCRKTR